MGEASLTAMDTGWRSTGCRPLLAQAFLPLPRDCASECDSLAIHPYIRNNVLSVGSPGQKMNTRAKRLQHEASAMLKSSSGRTLETPLGNALIDWDATASRGTKYQSATAPARTCQHQGRNDLNNQKPTVRTLKQYQCEPLAGSTVQRTH